MRKNGPKQYMRRASAVVEAAVITPLLLLGMLGMIEVGYAFMVRQSVSLASREGARAASLPGGTMADVQAAVDAAMASANLDGYTATSDIDSLSDTDLEVSVSVSIPVNRATFTGSFLGGGTFNVASTTTMRREGLDEQSN